MQKEETENLLDQGSKDVLTKAATPEELKTEVTSIQQEEERTGEKIHVPSAEELVARASSSMIINKKHLGDLITRRDGGKGTFKLNRKALNRVILAILDMPTGGLPVYLKSEDEKAAFILGQRLVADRFILMQHHISLEMKKRLDKQPSENKSEDKPSTDGGTNESN